MLFAAWGRLDKFNCRKCPIQKMKMRGCHQNPYRFDLEKEVDVKKAFKKHLSETRDRGASKKSCSIAAENTKRTTYFLANYGGIAEKTGEIWDCCPKSYQRFASQDANALAEDIFQYVSDIERGMPAQEDFTPFAHQMIRLVFDLKDALKAEDHEEMMEKARKKGKK